MILGLWIIFSGNPQPPSTFYSAHRTPVGIPTKIKIMLHTETFHLYSYYCSSCCQRIIIAAHLKGIPLKFTYIDLGARAHTTEEYKQSNPSASVPKLVVDFVKQAFTDGFRAYESLLIKQAGEGNFSFGGSFSMADVVLVPAVDQALMYRLDLDIVPNVKRIYLALKELGPFKAADWRNQGDTPEKFRIQDSCR
ncbi:unnamed protein product [Penicillium egyptiacum]|uniref:GST C-terminal domain-containing protein n=1 Tax=Penicillium egyptiacum TaxID=1303716 RepID=A0A9W4KLU0_9EURO|nr:unnamed protein product [Penicillium egyptiacum]